MANIFDEIELQVKTPERNLFDFIEEQSKQSAIQSDSQAPSNTGFFDQIESQLKAAEPSNVKAPVQDVKQLDTAPTYAFTEFVRDAVKQNPTLASFAIDFQEQGFSPQEVEQGVLSLMMQKAYGSPIDAFKAGLRYESNAGLLIDALKGNNITEEQRMLKVQEALGSDPIFMQRLGLSVGSIAGDLPNFALTNAAETASGGPLFALANQANNFGVNQALKRILINYQELKAKGENPSLTEMIKGIFKDVPLAYGRGAVEGVAVEIGGKIIAPAAEGASAAEQVLRGTGRIAAETGSLMAAQAALDQRMPTLQDFTDAAAVVTALKLSHRALRPLAEFNRTRKLSTLEGYFEQLPPDLRTKLESAKTPEEVQAVVEEIQRRTERMQNPIDVEPIEDVKPQSPVEETPKAPVAPQESESVKPLDIVPESPTIQEARIPTQEIASRPELMQFKAIEDASTGENQADRLSGQFDDLKSGVLLLWEPNNPAQYDLAEGQKYIVANGHHRLAFAQRENVPSLLTRIVREADGYTAADAMRLGAEINIAEGKGTVYDQAKYFRELKNAFGQDEASNAAKQTGRQGARAWEIADKAQDDVYSAFIDERITPEQASVIAQSAPNDAARQRLGLKAAVDGMNPQQLRNYLEASKLFAPSEKAQQQDLFGDNDSAIVQMEELSKIAARRQSDISEQIQSVSGASKRPEKARALGVNVEDPQAVKEKLNELRTLRKRWDNWASDSALIAQMKDEMQRLGYKPTFGQEETKAPEKVAISSESKPKSESPQTPDSFAKASDLSQEAAESAYRNMSFRPKEAGNRDIAAYVESVNSLHKEMMDLAQTPEQKAVAQNEMERYRQGYIDRQMGIWAARSKTASPMITGPAKFPVARNEKAISAEDKRVREFLEWNENAKSSIRKKILDARSTQQVESDDWRRLKADISDSIATIRAIDNSQGGFDRSLFTSSIKGKIERLAARGNTKLVNQALDFVREAQSKMKKPIFTDRNSIWRLREEAKSVEEAPKPTGEETLATYEGARIVDNKDDARVRIYFDGRPKADVANELKRNGWRWAPSEGAWQRQNTNAARFNAKQIMDRFFTSEDVGKAPESKEQTLAKKTVPTLQETEPRKPNVEGTGETDRRMQIIRNLSQAFDVPFKFGKFNKRALGIYNPFADTIRLKTGSDIETAAHELGHSLHERMFGDVVNNTPEQNAKLVDQALTPFLNELKPIARYEPFKREGFAEFTRMYITNPEAVRRLAPRFYEFFEKTLDDIDPELRKVLLEARAAYQKYLDATPLSRILSNVSIYADKSFLDRAGEPIQKFNFDKFQTQALDDLFPLKRLVSDMAGIGINQVEDWKSPLNAYRAARLYKGWIGKADVFLNHETFDYETLQKTGASLREIFKDIKSNEELNEFRGYLIAKRAIEKGSQGKATGFDKKDALAVVAKYEEKYQPIAKAFYKYQDAGLKYLRDSGAISNKSYMLIKAMNDYFIPFKRVLDIAEDAPSFNLGGDQLQSKPFIPIFKGSVKDVIDPFESVIQNTYFMIQMAERNRVGQTIAKLAGSRPIGGHFVEPIPARRVVENQLSKDQVIDAAIRKLKKDEPSLPAEKIEDFAALLEAALPETIQQWGVTGYNQKNVMTVYYDGKPRYYELSPLMAEMWSKGLNRTESNIFVKALSLPARMLRAGAILNPKFIEKNVVRDFLGTNIYTKNSVNPVYDPIYSFAASLGKQKLYVEWLKGGGGLSTMQSLDRPATAQKLVELRRSINVRTPIQLLRWLAEISEETNRLSEFRAAVRKEGESRLAKEIAAFAARDISIDYAKAGTKTRAINMIIPFWNATIQGGEKFFRSTFSDPATAAEAWARMFLWVGIPSLILSIVNEGDKDIEELSDTEQDFNFVTKIDGEIVKAPVPFEPGVIMHGLMRRMYKYFKQEDPEAWDGFLKSVMDAFTPNFVPQAYLPIAEVKANRNFFTGGRIIPPGKEGLLPELQYRTFTTESAKKIGEIMRYIPGLEKSQWTAPAVVEHLITSYGGGLGSMLLQTGDELLKAAGIEPEVPKPYRSISERFGLNAFSARYPRQDTKSITQFYDMYEEAQQIKRSFEFAAKSGDRATAERIAKMNEWPRLDLAYKAMQKIQATINNIYKNPDMSAQEKREIIDKLYIQQIEYARAINVEVKKMIRKMKEQQ